MGKRKLLLVLLLVLLSLFAFSVPVLAASGDSGGGIFSGLNQLANFVKRIFVPSQDYFHNKLATLSDKVNAKLGGVGYLYQMLHGFFSTLNNAPAQTLQFSLPDNFLYRGYQGISIDLFYSARPYLKLLNGVLTAAVCLFTAIACYHKLRSFFTL